MVVVVVVEIWFQNMEVRLQVVKMVVLEKFLDLQDQNGVYVCSQKLGGRDLCCSKLTAVCSGFGK